MKFPSFDEFMREPNPDSNHCLIVYMIGALSVTPGYSNKTPSEIYDCMVAHTIAVDEIIAKGDAEALVGLKST